MRALALALVAAGVLASSAAADGLPVLGIDVGAQGVTTVTGPDRYVTIPDGARTLVERTARTGGAVLGVSWLRGNFTIPAVAYDSSASGLSADGRHLVLIEPRRAFPRAETTFALLDASRLRLTRVITLRGDFSFDAISPHGATMFLINYTSPTDPTRYAVRAYDLRAGRLLAEPVVDPREHGDEMRGRPLTRTMSLDGRWAYTLYDGGGTKPFLHALDTVGRTAHCIDLPALAGRRDLWQLRLTRTQAGLRVGDVLEVSTTDFAIRSPRAAASFPVGAAAGGSVVVAALLGWALFRLRRRVEGQSVKGS